MTRAYRCSCGAAGDEGELVEHMVTVLRDDRDRGDHQWMTGEEPDQVARTRAARRRRDEVRRRLADAAGVTVEELREVLHG